MYNKLQPKFIKKYSV